MEPFSSPAAGSTGCGHGDRPAARRDGTRSPVLAMNGMVATSQPLASAAALEILREGGNAVDAALTAAAVLNVVEPMMTGIGGDMFALVHMQHERRPVGLNGSGWAGSKASLDRVRGIGDRPSAVQTVTVPGAVAGWFALHGRYGTLPMARILEPAIEYAENGFPVSEIIARQWQSSMAHLRANAAAMQTYLPDGRAPRHGDLFRNPELARTLVRLAEEGREVFYRGEIARAIVGTSDALGGFLTAADLETFEAAWVEPISTTYRGVAVYEMPPNTQGIATLEMLNILEAFDLRAMGHNSARYLHTLVEAKKLAFSDRDTYVSDADHSVVPVERLLSKEYAAERRRSIRMDRSMGPPPPGVVASGDTVYLAVVDRDRNVVSFINSLFASFGSGIVVEGTGICLHNRGSGFSLERGHANVIAPRKRPFHTLIPALVLEDDRPRLAFGVMGGDMQAQGHVQVLANWIDFGMDLQQAGEAARVRDMGPVLAVESAIGAATRKELSALGHQVVDAFGVFGGFQAIEIDPATGVLRGGSDPRKDGLAIGW